MRAKLVGAKLIELFKRLVTFDKSLGVYANGENNDYPERVERSINNSATAKPCAKLFRKYIVGRGIKGLNDFVINAKNKIKLRRFIFDVANSYAWQNGVFIHVNYNLEAEITSAKVFPYNHCLVGKKDDKKWHGKILVYENWNKEEGKKFDKTKIQAIDVFNPDKKIVLEQISKCKGDGLIEKAKNYKGQIFFYNPENTIYPLAHIDNVINDADSEFRVSIFKNISLRKGFFGKKIVVTPPMVGEDLRKPLEQLTDEEQAEKRFIETERDNFRNELQSFVGAENVDGMFHMEMEFEGDDIEKVMKFIDVDTNINDKLFAHTEKSVANNIRKAYANVPNILIENSDNSIFGQSGEMLKQAKIFYQEQTEEDRENIVRDCLMPILSKFKGFNMPDDLKIEPLIEIVNKSDEVN